MYLGVAVPYQIMGHGGRWNSAFVDIHEKWRCGQYGEYISLDRLCKCMGLPYKTGSGKDFSRLWKEEREKAVEYLKNDLQITWQAAEKMRVINNNIGAA